MGKKVTGKKRERENRIRDANFDYEAQVDREAQKKALQVRHATLWLVCLLSESISGARVCDMHNSDPLLYTYIYPSSFSPPLHP